jgi:hypothetical protein
MSVAEDSVIVTHVATTENAALAGASGSTLAYEQDSRDLPHPNLPTSRIAIANDPPLFFRWTEETIAAGDRVYDAFAPQLRSIAAAIGMPMPVIERSLKSHISRAIAADYRLLLLGRSLFAESDRSYIFDQSALMVPLLESAETAIATGNERSSRVWKNLLGLAGFILSAARPRRGPLHATSVIVEPFWENDEFNGEFASIYAATKAPAGGVAFVLRNAEGRTGRWLVTQGHRVLAWRDLRLPVADVVSGMRSVFSCAMLFVRHRSLPTALKAAWPRLLFDRYKYRAVFATVPSDYLLRVRGDVDVNAAMLHDTAAEAGIKTISFSHSTYFYPEYDIAASDYDFFGYSGPSERAAYARYWPDRGSQYIQTGQLDVDLPSKPLTLARRSSSDKVEKITVGIFTTTVDDSTLPHTTQDLIDFVREGANAAHTQGASIVLRDKNDFKRGRGDIIAVRNLVDLASVIHELDQNEVLVSDITAPEDDRGIRAEDLFPVIEIALVFSVSTVAFTLLSMGKKVLVYYPITGIDHPFAKHSPLLVAHDTSELHENLARLVSMTQSDYEEYIQPSIEWCGRPANGHLANDFLTQIDSAVWLPVAAENEA